MTENNNRVFSITTGKSVIIKQLFECIKPYIKETNMLINSDGIKISTLDISKSSVTYINLDAKKFEYYKCNTSTIVGIDTTVFFKTIKSTNRKETLTLYLDPNESDKLGIELNDIFAGKVKGYKIPLLALDDRIIQVDNMDFDYIINIPSTQFQQIIKDIHLLEGKTVEIKSIGKQLIFTSTDGLADFSTSITEMGDNVDHNILLAQNGEDVKSVKFSKSTNNIVQGKFKLSYLLNFIKASHLCDNMNIYLANDKPLILEYFVADLGVLRLLTTSINDV
jgi:proliferating cell nuclear antigen